MNEELKQRMLESLDKVLNFVEKAGDFTVEQAPLVVGEVLAWEFWYNSALVVIFSLPMLVALGTFSLVFFKDIIKNDIEPTDRGFPTFVTGVISGMIFVPCAGAVITSALAIIKVTVAPRLVILEKLRELL